MHQLASQVTSVSLEMALPAALGYWLDTRAGTAPWLLIVGAVLGVTVGMWHLLQIVAQDRRADRRGDD